MLSRKNKSTMLILAIPLALILILSASSLFLNLTVDLVPEIPDKMTISNPYREQYLEITDRAEIERIVDKINSSTIVGLSLFGLPTHPESGNDIRITFVCGDSESTHRFDGNHFETTIRGKKRIFFLAGAPLDELVSLLDQPD